jgi:hypothetical protein
LGEDAKAVDDFNGEISEILVYNRVLSGQEAARV